MLILKGNGSVLGGKYIVIKSLRFLAKCVRAHCTKLLKMKIKPVVIGILGAFVISIFLLSYFDIINIFSSREEIRCERKERAKSMVWDGIIVDKYIDKKNHNAKMLIIDNGEVGLFKTSILTIDSSGLFDTVEVGDSIAKYSGELSVRLRSLRVDTIIVLNYSCD